MKDFFCDSIAFNDRAEIINKRVREKRCVKRPRISLVIKDPEFNKFLEVIYVEEEIEEI
jgi:hypothetical protein